MNGKQHSASLQTGFTPLRAAYEYCVCYGGLLLFAAWGLLWTLASSLMYLLLPRRWHHSIGQRAIHLQFRAYLNFLRASGIVFIDTRELVALRESGPMVIAPNHPSLLDAVLVISELSQVNCIMKAKIWDNPLLGGGARLAGYIRNDAPKQMVRDAAAALRAGRSLLVFPEGTRTVRGPINHFKGGFALIAKHANVPVQTVFIETDTKFLGKRWPLLRKPEFPFTFRVRVGERFQVNGDVKQFVEQLETYFRQQLER